MTSLCVMRCVLCVVRCGVLIGSSGRENRYCLSNGSIIGLNDGVREGGSR